MGRGESTLKSIAEIDENFKVEQSVQREGMHLYNVTQAPFKLHGVIYQNNRFCRMPEKAAQTVSDGVALLHRRPSGGRVRFQTNSPYIILHAEMPVIGRTAHFPLTGTAGFDLYIDVDGQETYYKTFVPPYGFTNGYESVVDFGSEELRNVTINFPLYSEVAALCIGLHDKAKLKGPKPYRYQEPVVFYGSSITQGCCASRPGNTYQAMLSRRIGFDYLNLGFSGNAKGEPQMASYIKELKMSAFVYDYDYNAPDVGYLQKTHEKMFQTVRAQQPDLPIVLMSIPRFRSTGEFAEQLKVIRSTFEKARCAGDENVHLITGEQLFHSAGPDGTVDDCHPNDLGFFSMANALENTLKNILKGENEI